MSWVNRIAIIVMLAIFAVGLVEVVGTIGFDSLKNNTVENPEKTVLAVIGFNQGLNAITPAIRYDIPEKVPVLGGKSTFMINDIPLPDGTDMIILIPALFGWFFFLRWLRQTNISFVAWLLLAVFGTLFFIIFMWVMIKLFWYLVYILSAKALGMTGEQAISAREAVQVKVKDTIFVMILLSIFSVAAMTKIMFEAMRNKDG